MLTMRASSGFASGTWITSMRKYEVLGSSSGGSPEHPGSSSVGRTADVPETYTYTFSSSFGSVTTVWVCEPRQVCTAATCRGASRFDRSKTRTPRKRSTLTLSCTPSVPQSRRPRVSCADMKSRSPKIDTSPWPPGHTTATCNSMLAGSEMS